MVSARWGRNRRHLRGELREGMGREAEMRGGSRGGDEIMYTQSEMRPHARWEAQPALRMADARGARDVIPLTIGRGSLGCRSRQ